MKIGRPIPKAEVMQMPVEKLQDRVREEMKQMMQPAIPDSIVYHSNMSYLPWVVFVLVHALIWFVFF